MKGKLHKMVSGYILSLNGDIDDPYAIVNKELAKDHEWHRLSLKNCQAIERGYDLDELAENHWDENNRHFKDGINPYAHRFGFKAGFQKALELMGDKKFSEDDVINIAEYVRVASQSSPSVRTKYLLAEYQSQEQTEWDVEIMMEPCYYDDSLGGFSTSYKEGMPTEQPKLDENNCLILKRIWKEN